MKKITATLLALLLLLSLSVTAFATGVTNQGTITVNGAENGKTYELYKIFDITTVNGITAYSIPSGKETQYQESKYKDDANVEKTFSFLFEVSTGKVTNDDGSETTVTYVTRKTGTTKAQFTSWAKTNIALFGEKVQTVTAANATVAFNNVNPGYYYVKSPVGEGAAVMLADTSLTATVNEKNSTPGWGPEGGKFSDGETYYAGETINYTLSYKNAVNYANDGENPGVQVKTYTVEDTMGSGITFNQDSLVVKVNNETIADSDLTIEKSTNGFKVIIPWTNEDGSSKYNVNPSTIEVKYTATMGSNVIATAIVNEAKIYPDTNKTPGTETEKNDTVYTGQIVLNKVDNAGGTNKPLAGAKFKVKVNTGSGDMYLKQEGTASSYTYSEVAEAEATEFVTGTDGKVTLTGLKAGTYIFVETEAPAGYQLPATPEVAIVTLTLTKNDKGEVTAATAMSASREVVNSMAAAMPETGGMGTTMFYAVGSLLAVTALVFLVTQKRMRTVR